MSANTFLVFNLILLAVVLESDLGQRKISAFRIIRPLLGVLIITPFFLASPATNGWGLGLELCGALLGVTLGLAAAALLRVGWDPKQRGAYTRAGLGYAALWVAVSAARYGFAYGAKHLFNHPLKDFMTTNHVSAAALTDGLILVFVAMYLIRTLSLLTRRHTAPVRS